MQLASKKPRFKYAGILLGSFGIYLLQSNTISWIRTMSKVSMREDSFWTLSSARVISLVS